MKAVVFHDIGDVRLEDVDEPVLIDSTDAIIRVTASSICGTDLHMVRGTLPGMKRGTVLGHEAVGVVETVGKSVSRFSPGDRVVVCSSVACGSCEYCKAEEFSCCENSNPNGPEAGTCFFGGPEESGPINGLQAERARIPFADWTLVAAPDSVTDEDALLASDIFPTGYMAAEIADVKPGDLVAVFGCGPIGQMAIASAKLLGAAQIFAVDCVPDRLEMARFQGAIPIDYTERDPVKDIIALTNGYGADSSIDAVGIDAEAPSEGPAKPPMMEVAINAVEQRTLGPKTKMTGDQWRAGDAPGQVLSWCVSATRKSGVVSVVGVYPGLPQLFPIGMAVQKALTIRGANCHHRKYIPALLRIVASGEFRPSLILSKTEPLTDAIACYQHFDKREPGWIKVELLPAKSRAA